VLCAGRDVASLATHPSPKDCPACPSL
jgi:hypothetical protein